MTVVNVVLSVLAALPAYWFGQYRGYRAGHRVGFREGQAVRWGRTRFWK
jgi:hypothetical protein